MPVIAFRRLRWDLLFRCLYAYVLLLLFGSLRNKSRPTTEQEDHGLSDLVRWPDAPNAIRTRERGNDQLLQRLICTYKCL